MEELTLIGKIAIFALPVIFAITLHEAAHGYVARYFGDMTAAAAGRITLNPLKHIDPIGTILVPLAILLTSKLLGGPAIVFGWAKPVPVNFGNLRRPKQDMLWVAVAGPGANFVMAVFWALVIQLGHALGNDFVSAPLMLMGAAGVFINVILMALNLLPLPPLDGGRIAVSLLPVRQAMQYARLEPYGLFILLGLLFTGVLGIILWPLISLFIGLIALVSGLDPAQLVGLIRIVLS
ncbi:MAG TPA: site-2 protease family protein [Thiobacillus sp.]|nr:site-2 protease family protein [Thiobacillus sp.]